MKLIIGLGNPGKKYKNNRHNIGFMVVDTLAQELGITTYELSKGGKAEYAWGEVGGEQVELYKPQTFMNDSGFSVKYAKKKHQNLKISDIFVVHDDLDIPFGSYKIQLGTGPKDHKGLESIDAELGTGNYWHVRVGVDNRNNELGIMNYGKTRTPGEEYVLQDFGNEEMKKLGITIDEVVGELCKKLATS